MLYQPVPTLIRPRAVLGQAFVATLTRFVADYIRRQNESWAYYVGYGLGAGALATGIPNAEAVITVTATTADALVKVYLEKSPGAAEVDALLDGTRQAVHDLNAIENILEVVFSIPNDGQAHIISLVNLGSAVGALNPTNWMSILQVETNFATITEFGRESMPIVVISAQIKDPKPSGRNRNVQSCSIYVPLGSLTLAQIQAYHNAFITELDAVTDGQIIGSDVTIKFDLPAGLKVAPAANADVQEGGLLNWSLNGNTRTDSIRIPAVAQATLAAGGGSVNLANVDIIALRDLLNGTTAVAGLNIRACNPFGIEYANLLAGEKSFRK